MKIYTETSLRDFEAWSGAVDTLDTLIDKDLVDNLEAIINDEAVSGAEGWDDTSLNDFLWFETDTIAEWLGFRDWEDLDNDGEEEEEEEEYNKEEAELAEKNLNICLMNKEDFTCFCGIGFECESCPFNNKCQTCDECEKAYNEMLKNYINKIEKSY